MRVITESVELFGPGVLPWLRQEPVLNNFLAQQIEARPPGSVWLSVYDGEELVTLAYRTPPHPLQVGPMSPGSVVSGTSVEATAALVEWWAEADPALPAVNGALPESTHFARQWEKHTGATADLAGESRLFRADEVVPPRGVPGSARQATVADAALVHPWVEAAFAEMAPDEDTTGLAAMTDRMIAAGEVWLWCDGDPVSMLWTYPPQAWAVRVGGVFTPGPLRGRGYASAAVAAVSQHLLDHGARACCLYTNLANPTSNKIYQAIGYRAVQDGRLWRFRYPSTASPEEGRPRLRLVR